jgi:hypothetical protein
MQALSRNVLEPILSKFGSVVVGSQRFVTAELRKNNEACSKIPGSTVGSLLGFVNPQSTKEPRKAWLSLALLYFMTLSFLPMLRTRAAWVSNR